MRDPETYSAYEIAEALGISYPRICMRIRAYRDMGRVSTPPGKKARYTYTEAILFAQTPRKGAADEEETDEARIARLRKRLIDDGFA